MTNKTKIIFIYTSVAILSGLMIFGFVFLRELQDEQAKADRPLAVGVGREEVSEILTVDENIILTNQDGEEVSIFDLKDKVWVFAQFFAKCPRCLERNYTDLRNLYEKYKDNPDFMIVCISIDPETDNVQRLKEYADAVGADSSQWWFLRGEQKKVHDYLSDELAFMDVRERVDPAEIASQGRFAHDLGVAVFDKGLVMRVKVDLAFARDQKNEVMEKEFLNKLHSAIAKSLAK